jgi:hypothetical protein
MPSGSQVPPQPGVPVPLPPTKCVRCKAVLPDIHAMVWIPREPPKADGYARTVCQSCWRGIVGVAPLAAGVVRDVQEASEKA